MSVIIGTLSGVDQVLTLSDGIVCINDEPQAIRRVTQEEIDKFAASLAAVPDGDEAGQEAYRNSRRILFLIELLSRSFSEECTAYLEHIIGVLHFRVLTYLGEAEDPEDGMELPLPKGAPRPGRHEEHHDGCGCGHEHHHH